VALANKAVKLHGWVYDIKTGEVSAVDDATETWVPVEERYASELASAALEAHAC
jgi:carbonic anhydrase